MHNKVTKKATKQHGCYDDTTDLLSPQFTICSIIEITATATNVVLPSSVLFILLPHHIYVSLGLNGMRHKSQNNVHFWLSDF